MAASLPRWSMALTALAAAVGLLLLPRQWHRPGLIGEALTYVLVIDLLSATSRPRRSPLR